MVGNAYARGVLVRDRSRVVAMAVVRSPTITDNEVTRYAGMRDLHEEVIRHIAQQREWLRLYPVKVALCHNPKTPLSVTTRLLPHLRERDLRNVARSKGIPSAVSKAAANLMSQRK